MKLFICSKTQRFYIISKQKFPSLIFYLLSLYDVHIKTYHIYHRTNVGAREKEEENHRIILSISITTSLAWSDLMTTTFHTDAFPMQMRNEEVTADCMIEKRKRKKEVMSVLRHFHYII